MRRAFRVLMLCGIAAAALAISSCGGGGNTTVSPQRPPQTLTIATASLPTAVEAATYNQTVQAQGGSAPYTFSLVQGQLPPGLGMNSSGVVSGASTWGGALTTYNFTAKVQDSTGATAQKDIQIAAVAAVKFTTTTLPDASANVAYQQQVQVTGGTAPYSFRLTAGALPSGLTLSSSGLISGTATGSATATVTIRVDDSGPPQQNVSRSFTLTVEAPTGRHDTLATATPISNGDFTASISPLADPPLGTVAADIDVYRLSAQPGATVQLEVFAERLNPRSPMDSVLEIVDATGTRLHTCASDPADTQMAEWCMDDDYYDGTTLDSMLRFHVPGTATGTQTFYVRVLDWRGDARPDMVYRLSVTGAN